MSKKYIPLYTKYRPQIFADITGQESTVKALTNAIESGRIMHAYLFCGPRGTGKTSSARIFAKSLNCENGPTVTPCGKCPGCLDVINSTPVDVIEIDAASNRSVEDARNILEKVQYAPLHGKYKIYIIDEVHMLTTEASNTLLKTLEEPPENVIFILATTESHKVLETIVSRCQRYDFRRITTSDIVKRLTYIAKSEDIKITEEAILAVAKNSAGGMRDAVALLDQLSVLGQNRDITVDDVNELLGQISYDKIYEIAECIHSSDTESALKLLNEIHDRGNEPGRVLTALIKYFRDMLILKSCSDKNIVFNLTQINEEIFDKIKTQSEKFNSQTLIYFEDRLAYHFGRLKENTNKYMWAELCIIDLTSSPQIPSVADLEKRISILEAALSSGQPAVIQHKTVPAPISIKPQISEPKSVEQKTSDKFDSLQQTAAPQKHEEQSKPITTNNIGQSDEAADWAQITAEIKGPAKFFYSKLAKPIEINRHKIVIGFSNEGGAKQANDPAKKSLLQASACKYFDVETIQIEIKTGSFDVKKNSNEQHPLIADLVPKQERQEEQKVPLDTEIKEINAENKTVEKIVPQNGTDNTSLSEECDFDSGMYESGFDEDLTEENNNISSTVPINSLDISDTAKSILELFNGKIVEE
ncbi:MAG: DNA polymerase III subunit gamma/tau [Candidatus Gastranaerophilaceae bacterium]